MLPACYIRGIHGLFTEYSSGIHGVFICIGYVSVMYRLCIGYVSEQTRGKKVKGENGKRKGER